MKKVFGRISFFMNFYLFAQSVTMFGLTYRPNPIGLKWAQTVTQAV